MDVYHSFDDLQKHETYSQDYLIDMKTGRSRVALIAPHGGGIEFGTAAIAGSIAHPEHTFWAFRGIKRENNRILHIASTNFDAPGALGVAKASQVVVTVHGCRDESPVVYVGGRHDSAKSRLRDALLRWGFDTRSASKPGLRGESPLNLCNRCTGGKGVQLEISTGLRKMMFVWHSENGTRRETEHFFRFTEAVRTALRPFE